ncbi:hypothetical protein GGI42DRAFT_221944 [Trichoderma sp. SZMC 28013]
MLKMTAALQRLPSQSRWLGCVIVQACVLDSLLPRTSGSQFPFRCSLLLYTPQLLSIDGTRTSYLGNLCGITTANITRIPQGIRQNRPPFFAKSPTYVIWPRACIRSHGKTDILPGDANILFGLRCLLLWKSAVSMSGIGF